MNQSAAERTDYCVFRRGDQGFALSTNLAKEVIEGRGVTPVPEAPSELLGALNLRGEVVPLVALDSFLGIPPRPRSRTDALLILGSGDLRFAAVVDSVATVKHLSPWEIRREVEGEPPATALVRGYTGNAGDRLRVLDGDALVTAVVQRIAEGFRQSAQPKPPVGPGED